MRVLLSMILFLLAALPASAQQVWGYTHRSHSPDHGTQISYLTKTNAYLWYPGNEVILEGRWKRQGKDICFDYGSNTYNPSTGHSGGGWECMPFNIYWWVVETRMPGDLFGLQQGGPVPFKLKRDRTTLEKLLAKARPGFKPPPIESAIVYPDGTTLSVSCESIIADKDRSEFGRRLAVMVYFHGQFMGEPCAKVDFDRAYALAQEAGISFAAFERILRERAAGGHPSAISALKRLGLPPAP